jgi:hypothetical protein
MSTYERDTPVLTLRQTAERAAGTGAIGGRAGAAPTSGAERAVRVRAVLATTALRADVLLGRTCGPPCTADSVLTDAQSCGHYYCQLCLAKHATTHVDERRGGDVTCPSCHTGLTALELKVRPVLRATD